MHERNAQLAMEVPSQATRLALNIGGFSLGLWCEKGMPAILDREHLPFVASSGANDSCDLEFDVSWAHALSVPDSSPDFSSGGLWSAHRDHTGTKFFFSSPVFGAEPYKAAWLDPTFSRGHLLLNRSVFPLPDAIFPLEYPIDELVLMHRLALGEGVELHALGVVDQDSSGYLFLGHSGDGKSTTARLWMRQPGVRLLSDDRIIIRLQDGVYRMYGTPWHGDAGVSSPSSAPLSAIFLLEQAPRHELVPIAQSQAAAELFARAFLPHYLKSGIEFTLDFLDRLTRSIPCSIFRFAPTDDAVEAIRHAHA
ncbi:MAG TPA: hypothetical protein VL128_01155 [Candidatus Eisenbacteria bacterium]|nr:hypothetical protein [Candidatus Eisenbacteria bacterium]